MNAHMSSGLTSAALTTCQPLGGLAWLHWRVLLSLQDIDWPWTSWMLALAAFWPRVARARVWNGHTALGPSTPHIPARLLSSPASQLLLALPREVPCSEVKARRGLWVRETWAGLSLAVGPREVAFIPPPRVLSPCYRTLGAIEMILGIPSLVKQWLNHLSQWSRARRFHFPAAPGSSGSEPVSGRVTGRCFLDLF